MFCPRSWGKIPFQGGGEPFAIVQAEDMEEDGEVCTCGTGTSAGKWESRESGDRLEQSQTQAGPGAASYCLFRFACLKTQEK